MFFFPWHGGSGERWAVDLTSAVRASTAELTQFPTGDTAFSTLVAKKCKKITSVFSECSTCLIRLVWPLKHTSPSCVKEATGENVDSAPGAAVAEPYKMSRILKD